MKAKSIIVILILIIGYLCYDNFNKQAIFRDPNVYLQQSTIDNMVIGDIRNLIEDTILNWVNIKQRVINNIGHNSLKLINEQDTLIRINRQNIFNSTEIAIYRLKSFTEIFNTESYEAFDSNGYLIEKNKFKCRYRINIYQLKKEILKLETSYSLPKDGLIIIINENNIMVRDLRNRPFKKNIDLLKLIKDWKQSINCDIINYNIAILLDFQLMIPPN